tara:strand:- start:877 stop:1410 length:534 start_codon:yes stop_codon:yes gene_type:complete
MLIYHSKMRDKEKFTEICNIVTSTLQLPENSLVDKSRKADLSTARQIAIVIGLNKGIDRNTVADLLNRHRTSTYYFYKEHDKRFDSDINYAKSYTKILKEINGYKETSKVFLEKAWLIKHLEEFGLKNSKTKEILFTLKTGDVSYQFYSNYYNFANDYDLVQKAMKGYSKKLNWVML